MIVHGVVLGVMLAAAGFTHADSRLVVGGEDGYEPYETLDEAGNPVGFNVDLMRTIGREMGLEVEFRLGSWDQARLNLEQGSIDVLGMFVSEQRRETVLFASPHIIVYHRIFRLAHDDTIRGIDDLAGRRVIVQRAAFSHEFLLASGLQLDLTLVDSDFEGLELLAAGDHDAALLTEHGGRHAMRRIGLDRLTVSGPPVLPVEYALAVRLNNQALLDILEEGLERVTESGEFDRIYERWLQPVESDLTVIRRNGWMLTAIMLLLALAALAVWQMKRLSLARADRLEATRQLAFLRERDALTGLYNRKAFESRLESFLAESATRDDGAVHALMTINVDRFRLINDRLGHARADRFLRNLSELLVRELPAKALLARLGGDEFSVLLADADHDSAIAVAEQLLAAVRSAGMKKDADGIRPGLSIGLVPFGGPDHSVAQLLRRADCACLAAREDGGDRVHVWHHEDRRLAERLGLLRWVAEIQTALEEDRLLLYWQPMMAANGDDRRIVAVEILVRMRDRDGDIVPAGRFMPAAERYFLAPRIDRWVVSSVLDWLERHPEVPRCLESVNINLSGRSLGDARFLEFLEERIQQSGELSKSLCFEITETSLISNLAFAQSALERLRQSGCRFALDDFGIGLSSMGYLKRLPVDYLKIDGSFVRGIDSDHEALGLIEQINRLGHAMGKVTVAEHVETDLVGSLLKKAGVDLLQGYLYSVALPMADLARCCHENQCRLPERNGEDVTLGSA